MKRHFLLNIKTPLKLTKKDIDEGNYSQVETSLANCVRSVFLLSHNIRKKSTLTIFLPDREYVVFLDGERLRYLDASERGILLLLSRAFNNKEKSKKTKMTPGIMKFYNFTEIKILSNLNSQVRFLVKCNKVDIPTETENSILFIDLDENTINSNDIPFELEKKPFCLPVIYEQPSSNILEFHKVLDAVENKKID
ncbi:MAG: hypothetical protein ACTSUV_03890 [Candidatus Ranarchaeia archaeon]